MPHRFLIFMLQAKNMNPLRSRIVTAIAALLIISCAGRNASDAEHKDAAASDGVWKEMDDFHMIMAETFHPYKDSSNLEPAKSRADELVNAANEWASASLPAKVDNEDVRAQLQQLRTEAATLAESVRSSDDNIVAEHLTKLHDTFHAIQETWYGH